MMERVARWSDTSSAGQRLRRLVLSNPLTGRLVRGADRARLEALARREDPVTRSKGRWRSAHPDPGLTWGTRVSGEAAARAAEGLGVFGPSHTVLELGPGYGRILNSVLELGLPFARYVGLDLSERNVEHLRGRFDDPRVEFVQGDAESARLDGSPDALISFLTFKHLYPTFEGALANLLPQLAPGAIAVFDLLEGNRAYFHRDGTTYIRHYSADEARKIAERAGLREVQIGSVEHEPGRTRMLVSGRRAP